jgi:hypothetical protein
LVLAVLVVAVDTEQMVITLFLTLHLLAHLQDALLPPQAAGARVVLLVHLKMVMVVALAAGVNILVAVVRLVAPEQLVRVTRDLVV